MIIDNAEKRFYDKGGFEWPGEENLPRSGLLEPGNKPDKNMWVFQNNDSVSTTPAKSFPVAGYTNRYMRVR